MGIVPIRIMDGGVGTHPVRNELLLYELRHQPDPHLSVQLHGQSDDELTGEAAVLRLFGCLNRVPELFPVLPFGRGHGRQEHMLPYKTALAGVVVPNAVIVVIDAGTAHISGSTADGAPDASRDDLGFHVEDRHNTFVLLSRPAGRGFCFFSRKEDVPRKRRISSWRRVCSDQEHTTMRKQRCQLHRQ